MKRLILLELILLFLATTFQSDSIGGWVQQTLPVNKTINDIYFIDSLTGWVVESNTHYPPNDTGYILKTTDSGNSWTIQNDSLFNYYSIQFLNANTGYAAGGTGRAKFLITTNGGNNWTVTTPFGSGVYAILDISFVSVNTGWVCSDDFGGGGVYKTTDGGSTWQQQAPASYRPQKLFFINKDTGWAGSNETNGKLYRTLNGGTNWNLQFTSNIPIESIFFLNKNNGWMRGGTGNGVIYTTNGGFNWQNAQGNTAAGFDLRFVNDSIGFSGMQAFTIPKSTDGGKTWGVENSPIYNNMSVYMLNNDTLRGWAGGTGLVYTSDGGGVINVIHQISNEVPKDFKLFQNYPNPFNPQTVFSYQLRVSSHVKMMVYDIMGKEIMTLVNQKQNPGTYEVEFDGSNLSSGVYFYSLICDGRIIDTKKMVLLK